MNKVFVTPGGGYGNRFPLLCSGMRIADLTGRDLYVNWLPQEEMPVLLGDLFGRDLPFFLGQAPGYVFPLARDENHLLVRPPRVPETPTEIDINLWGIDYYAYGDEQRSISGEPADPFMREIGKYFKSLPLADDIQNRVSEIENRFDPSTTLGVHLRRGAKNSIYTEDDRGRDWWTMESYVKAIEIVMERYPHLNSIYVASNSDEARDYMTSRFKFATSNEKAGTGWHDLHALKEAFVEMIILSRCPVILRQNGTTYSSFAAVINLADLVTVTNLNGQTNDPELHWSIWS